MNAWLAALAASALPFCCSRSWAMYFIMLVARLTAFFHSRFSNSCERRQFAFNFVFGLINQVPALVVPKLFHLACQSLGLLLVAPGVHEALGRLLVEGQGG